MDAPLKLQRNPGRGSIRRRPPASAPAGRHPWPGQSRRPAAKGWRRPTTRHHAAGRARQSTAVGFVCRRAGLEPRPVRSRWLATDAGIRAGQRSHGRPHGASRFSPSRGFSLRQGYARMPQPTHDNAPWDKAPLRTAAPSRKRPMAARPSCGKGVGDAHARAADGSSRRIALSARCDRKSRRAGAETRTTTPGHPAAPDAARGDARQGDSAGDRQFRLRTIGNGRTLCYRAGRTSRPALLPPATLHLHQARRP